MKQTIEVTIGPNEVFNINHNHWAKNPEGTFQWLPVPDDVNPESAKINHFENTTLHQVKITVELDIPSNQSLSFCGGTFDPDECCGDPDCPNCGGPKISNATKAAN